MEDCGRPETKIDNFSFISVLLLLSQCDDSTSSETPLKTDSGGRAMVGRCHRLLF
jgi:hypothetical protein